MVTDRTATLAEFALPEYCFWTTFMFLHLLYFLWLWCSCTWTCVLWL